MRKLLIWIAGLAIAGAFGFLVVTDPAFLRIAKGGSPAGPEKPPDLANGETLFYAGGCASCHATPNQPDRRKLGGGLALHSPFGTFYPPNISPDPTDGLGAWKLDDFVRAMREGVSPKGAHYYPSFPYTSYQRMGRQDLADLFGFLRMLEPIKGVVREHDLPFPLTIRRLLGGWKLLNWENRLFAPDPNRDAAWNRGAYLVEGPGHCAECHSPRNLMGAIIADRRFSGGPDPEGQGYVPNITPHKDGIAGWSRGEIAEALKTGETPTYNNLGGSMKSVVRNMAELSDADREAMASYLLSLTPIPGKAPVKGKE